MPCGISPSNTFDLRKVWQTVVDALRRVRQGRGILSGMLDVMVTQACGDGFVRVVFIENAICSGVIILAVCVPLARAT
jgi:hypothetical protein